MSDFDRVYKALFDVDHNDWDEAADVAVCRIKELRIIEREWSELKSNEQLLEMRELFESVKKILEHQSGG
ncbi:MAG: hypothetical protein OEY52_17095 [Gammaproteobacteria bacterium]|nr:hypothetical protein [Gammaproteobacteria bacterium]